ncbi:MAG TPA: hypothetical protein VF812_12585 [Ktedonobacterales bacterium]
MRSSVRLLLYAARACAIGAVIAGLALGMLYATLGAAFVCVDSCPPPVYLFDNLGPTSVGVLTPCLALEALALVAFLIYCAATRQARRAAIVIVALLGIGAIGGALLNTLFWQGEAAFVGGRYGLLSEGPAPEWVRLWGLSLTAAAFVWSGTLAILQWRR